MWDISWPKPARRGIQTISICRKGISINKKLSPSFDSYLVSVSEGTCLVDGVGIPEAVQRIPLLLEGAEFW